VKVYISADIEGVTGVTHWDETELSKPESAAAREQMTAEVAAACEGALQAGATEIWVKDAHDTGRNILAAKLPEPVRLIRGWSGHPFVMLQELDDTFTAVILIGYHTHAGAEGNPLSHTLTGSITRMTLNDQPTSEFLLCAYTAGFLKVPLVWVSGDQGLCDEVTRLNPKIGVLPVKVGIGDSTVSLHPALAASKIRQGVHEALQGDLARCQVPLPPRFSLQVQYQDHFKAYRNAFFPGARPIDSTTIQFETDSFYEVLRCLLFTT
jgi:D-amino peptidase